MNCNKNLKLYFKNEKNEVSILKKNFILLCIMLIVVAAGIKITWDHFGMQDYYVKVTETRNVQAETNGRETYQYDLDAYDKHGNKIRVTFQTKESLNTNTFLHVELFKPKKDAVNGANSLELVTSAQVPKKAKEKLNITQ